MLVEHIIAPMKAVCIATMITSGIDELTFKKFYKTLESTMPNTLPNYKKFGFIFTTTDKLMGGADNAE